MGRAPRGWRGSFDAGVREIATATILIIEGGRDARYCFSVKRRGWFFLASRLEEVEGVRDFVGNGVG